MVEQIYKYDRPAIAGGWIGKGILVGRTPLRCSYQFKFVLWQTTDLRVFVSNSIVIRFVVLRLKDFVDDGGASHDRHGAEHYSSASRSRPLFPT
jgi:hypothetical protein